MSQTSSLLWAHITAGFLFFQIPCADLHEVIDALVEKTAGTLQPFLLEEPYEENISEATTQHMHFINGLVFCLYMPFLKFFFCRQRTFLPMMRMERGSSTPPPPAPCQRLPPCLQNKVSLNLTDKPHADNLGHTALMITAFTVAQTVGPAAPCPGLPPPTGAS